MGTYWDEFIEEMKRQLPYMAICEILEEYHKYLERKGVIT